MRYLIDSPDFGRRVEVYRNLHKKCYSIRDVKTRRVIFHTKEVYLQDVTYKVSQRGRDRVRNEMRKNVHATVRGVWLPPTPELMLDVDDFYRVNYNPYFSLSKQFYNVLARGDGKILRVMDVLKSDSLRMMDDFSMYAKGVA